MKRRRGRFTLRRYSRFPIHTQLTYVGKERIGQGVLRELSRTGGSIVGNYPVTPGETLRLRILHPTQLEPLIIEKAHVQWVNGLEFGVTFEHLDKRQAERLQHLLNDLLGRVSYSSVSGREVDVADSQISR